MGTVYLGHLLPSDPLYHYFRHEIQPQLSDSGVVDYRVFKFTASNDVYLYEERLSNTRFIGKFFLSERQPDRALASRRLEREFHHLEYMRQFGFDRSPHYIARPLGRNAALNELLVGEFCYGELLSSIIRRALHNRDDSLLYQKLTALAYFLSQFHNRTVNADPVNFAETCSYGESLSLRLRQAGLIQPGEEEDLKKCMTIWRNGPIMWEDRQVIVHGDATPENFYLATTSMSSLSTWSGCVVPIASTILAGWPVNSLISPWPKPATAPGPNHSSAISSGNTPATSLTATPPFAPWCAASRSTWDSPYCALPAMPGSPGLIASASFTKPGNACAPCLLEFGRVTWSTTPERSHVPMFKALLFDINGTVTDILTDETHDETYQFMANLLGYYGVHVQPDELRTLFWQLNKEQRESSPEEFPEFDAAGIFSTILTRHASIYTRNLPKAKLKQLPTFLAEAFRAATLQRLQLYPDVDTVMQKLKQQFRLAAISDGQSLWAHPELFCVGLQNLFDPLIISSDLGFRKPDPRIYQLALDTMHLTPAEVIFIGNDMYRDVWGAHQLGLKTIFFKSNQGDHKSRGVEPDYIIYEFNQLPTAIRFLSDNAL